MILWFSANNQFMIALFWFCFCCSRCRYFEQNEFKDSRIGFVSPSVSQLVKLCDGKIVYGNSNGK